MSTLYNHAQIGIVDNKGNVNVIYPNTTGADVTITPNTNANTAKTVQTLVNSLGNAAFKSTDQIMQGHESTTRIFYVTPNGSDSNDGGQTTPFKTIQHAVNKCNNLYRFDIRISAGAYPEEIQIDHIHNIQLTIYGNVTVNSIIARWATNLVIATENTGSDTLYLSGTSTHNLTAMISSHIYVTTGLQMLTSSGNYGIFCIADSTATIMAVHPIVIKNHNTAVYSAENSSVSITNISAESTGNSYGLRAVMASSILYNSANVATLGETVLESGSTITNGINQWRYFKSVTGRNSIDISNLVYQELELKFAIMAGNTKYITTMHLLKDELPTPPTGAQTFSTGSYLNSYNKFGVTITATTSTITVVDMYANENDYTQYSTLDLRYK